MTRQRVVLSIAWLAAILLVAANALPYEFDAQALKTVSVDHLTFARNGWFWAAQFALPIIAFAATIAYTVPRLRTTASTALVALGVGGYLLTLQDFGYQAVTAGRVHPQRIGMVLTLLACAMLVVLGVREAAPSRLPGRRARFALPAVLVGALCLVLGAVIPFQSVDGAEFAIFYGRLEPAVLDWYGVGPVGLAVLAVLLATVGSSLDRRAAGGLFVSGTLAALVYVPYFTQVSSHGWGGAFVGLAGGILIALVGAAVVFVPAAESGTVGGSATVTLTDIDAARRRDAEIRQRSLARDLFVIAVAVPGVVLLAYERTTGVVGYFIAIGVLLVATGTAEYLGRRREPTDLVFPSKATWDGTAADVPLAAREALSMRTLVHPAERTRLLLALLAAAAASAILVLGAIAGQSAGKALAAIAGSIIALLVLIWWGQQVLKARLLGRSIRVSAETLPRVQALLDEVRLTLQYFRPVDVYVVDKGTKAISTSSYLGTRIIVIEGSLVAGLDDPERRQQVKFLLGRSLGALKAKHSRVDLIVVYLQTVDMLKFVSLLLLPWYRAVTYSGDQIGMVCCADVRAALQMTRQLLVGKELAEEVDDGAIIPQARLVQHRFMPRLAQLLSAEPHNTNRYANLLCFARYHDPELWERLRASVDAEQAATLDRLWERSPYRRRVARRERRAAAVPTSGAVPTSHA